MKPVFCLKRHPLNVTAMHCKTLEEAITFAKFLNRNGKVWCTGARYYKTGSEKTVTPEECFEAYGNDLCYYFNSGTRGRKSWASCHDNILEFSDYDWTEEEINIDMSKCLSLI